ncbi:RNA-binding S4 domain-containing protein [Weissella muntiaci]|jgi:ribosomal 50S subunit-recycling heat shock protein|uniref:RQC P-site tRNA stabilizing factor n=1 Tax=Weissella muntiaci TaxID=2508881 RepID=A0A6C2C416_9LACO|nr:RNA-binding S4 domain-containing protein [Weissella muntiaci]TYC48522.1 RNA-binding S4 domain-containing protein [Weissella muntiaci]
MRLDKFLKVSRLIKRRTVAKEIADQGRIDINGKTVKSSSDVKVGDELTIRFGNKVSTIKVQEIVETTKKDDADRMYEIVGEEYLQESAENTDK